MNILSPYELTLVKDAEVILAKNRIIEKVASSFSLLAEEYQIIGKQLPLDFNSAVPPKISRGEKYEGLPYIVLDYPRIFSHENIFAIRTLFWWGNYCSTTLHLKGIYQTQYAYALRNAIQNEVLNEWYVQVDGNMWQHSINEDYNRVEPSVDYQLETTPFIKITKKIPLKQWDQLYQLLKLDFEKIVNLL